MLTPLFFVFCIAAHDLMEVGTWQSGVLGGMGDVPLMDRKFGRNVPSIEGFQYLFLGLCIRQVKIVFFGGLALSLVGHGEHTGYIRDTDAVALGEHDRPFHYVP